ncbi:transcription elongation factor B polypeptide 3 [Momordica charantia]|uniref:Transcription elongation factor B polypeptide 3 n=1 Tax=Momordica charantia TaxID=3673 RepID=A0A6J1D807_MOMCH|nr:transcription elongation factor B polypeptide 3 [Momordica charantia]
MFRARKIPSLVDLCVNTAIDNLRFLGDVGETDIHLLERILPHCTLDQLMHVEKSSKGRDLTPVTDKLWKKFYERQFGKDSTNAVIARMQQKKVSFRWLQLYEAKLEDLEKNESIVADRIKQCYKNEDARKQKRQIQICNKVPPSSNKRSFGGTGFGYNVSNTKNNLLKKAKIEVLQSQEMKNIKAWRRNAVQKGPGVSSTKKPMFAGRESASTSKHTTTHMARR